MAEIVKNPEKIEWDARNELLLFHSMMGHKPVGVNRYFMMALILKKFGNYLKRDISSKVIWDHLDTMYDMPALHESEIIPFPTDEQEFELPFDEFRSLIEAKKKTTAIVAKAEPNGEAKPYTPKVGKKFMSVGPKHIQLALNPSRKREAASEEANSVQHSKLPTTSKSHLDIQTSNGSVAQSSGSENKSHMPNERISTGLLHKQSKMKQRY